MQVPRSRLTSAEVLQLGVAPAYEVDDGLQIPQIPLLGCSGYYYG